MWYRMGMILALFGFSHAASGQQIDTPVPAPSHQSQDVPVDAPPPATIAEVKWEKVDQMPEFPGGQRALMSYLSGKLQYPAKAVEAGVEGKVLVEFVVCENGALCEEKIIRRLGSGCDEEVLRVVKAMPRWQPARKDGKPVKTIYRLPVQFKFAEEAISKEKK
ncbi:energy transducer TonB [Taibaiella koreensis]|uniref:energy transducer TonB n=1 Tax=Taibaiella koreensis TaxID=1268548 RepID=UPI000E59F40C|nr:energy transducer TonB [Taibaiella koreensis]